MTDPVSILSEERDEGRFAPGCGTGCFIQACCLMAAVIIGLSTRNSTIFTIGMTGWGFFQWIAVIPLVMHQRAKGQRKFVQGLLTSAFLGLLLSSACAAGSTGTYLK